MPDVPACLLLGVCFPDRVAATSRDLAEHDFQDRAIYTQLARPAEHRSISEDAGEDDLRQDALTAIRDWDQQRSP